MLHSATIYILMVADYGDHFMMFIPAFVLCILAVDVPISYSVVNLVLIISVVVFQSCFDWQLVSMDITLGQIGVGSSSFDDPRTSKIIWFVTFLIFCTIYAGVMLLIWR